MEKAILIIIDGTRPDGFLACGNPFTQVTGVIPDPEWEGKVI